MTQRPVLPYGGWPSSVTAASLTEGAVQVTEPRSLGPDLFWLEGRPDEGGRVGLVRRDAAGRRTDLTPAPFNVRSRVHEYGGGASTVGAGVALVVGFADSRMYRIDLAADGAVGEPTPITPAGLLRYGDPQLLPGGERVVAVREDHRADGEPVDDVVLLDVRGTNADGGVVIASGADFYSAPRVSRDGRRVAWVQWQHPNLPFDDTEIWVAELGVTGGSHARRVAGGPGESVCFPSWAPGGSLVFMSDRDGHWCLYEADIEDPSDQGAALWSAPHDFCDAPWQLGDGPYAWLSDTEIGCRWLVDGVARVGVLDLAASGGPALREIEIGVNTVLYLAAAAEGRLLVVAGYPDRPGALVQVDPADGAVDVLASFQEAALEPEQVSVAQPCTWATPDGERAHGWFYPPVSAEVTGPEGARPPLLVFSHGGPTGMALPAFTLEKQFWTSRGFAILDVNYRGSAGFGRAYRQRLYGQWGVLDVDDCTSGAHALAAEGRVDGSALMIRGGSAGGYTTLAALTFRDDFAGGASYFGVSDLEMLGRDTHKLESRYLDQLIGPWPEAADLYRERSPIHHVDRLSAPMILLQGADDRVVPPAQAELMANALRAKGLPVELVVFEGEGHGFRQASTIISATEAELAFYARVLGVDLP